MQSSQLRERRQPHSDISYGAMTPLSVDEVDNVIDPLSLGIEPLVEEKYPRVIEKKRPEAGYYIAMGLVLFVWMITPLSWYVHIVSKRLITTDAHSAYLLWFVLLGQGLSGASGLTATIFAAYALTEVVFAIYTSYLIKYVQTPSPPSTLPLEKRNELFHKVLRSDLAYSKPTRPRFKDDDGPEKQMEKELFKLYELGQITPAQYHHLNDRRYEEMHGMQVRQRVAKLTEDEKDVITAFVEDEPGEREERLRDQIEKDVGFGQDDWDGDEGIIDRAGRVIKLHPMDRRAVEFRERLRTW